MTQHTADAGATDARRRYINILRSMNPDPVLSQRLDVLENAPKVLVTFADVRDVVAKHARDLSPSELDQLVKRLDAALDLVGEHNMTTALRNDTVEWWIEREIEGGTGDEQLDELLHAAMR